MMIKTRATFVAGVLLAGQASAFDAARYPSPTYNAPQVDKLTIQGPGSTGPIDGMTVGGTALSSAMAGKAPLASPAFSGLPTLNGVGTTPYGMKFVADGQTQFLLQTIKGGGLDLYAYKNGAYIGQPLSITADDNGDTGSTTGVVTLGSSLRVVSTGAPADAHAMNAFESENTGDHGGGGFSNVYKSKASNNAFDVGRNSLSVFDPQGDANGTWTGQPPKYDHFYAVITPESQTKSFGVAVGEWNIINRGVDDGFKRDRSIGFQTTGGLLMVPETDVLGTGIAKGLSVGYGFAVSRSGGQSIRQSVHAKVVGSISGTVLTVASVNSGSVAVGQDVTGPGITGSVKIVTLGTGTGGAGTYNLSAAASAAAGTALVLGPFDFGKFYIGYNVEPNSIVGLTGRGHYLTGDITGTPAMRPYAPTQTDGAWLHGHDTTLATFVDGYAHRLKVDQKIAWLNADGTVAGTLSTPKAWTTYTPAAVATGGTGVVLTVQQAAYELVGKSLKVRGQLLVTGNPAPTNITVELPAGSVARGSNVGTLYNLGTGAGGFISITDGQSSFSLTTASAYSSTSGSYLSYSLTLEVQ